MTVSVKAIDSQRWICRIHLFQFNAGPPLNTRRSGSSEPVGGGLKLSVPKPALALQRTAAISLGAAVGMLLIRKGARLLHAQVGSCARWVRIVAALRSSLSQG